MKAILVPVKLFAKSKMRLAPVYSADARTAFAEALCVDFFRMLAEVKMAARIFVASQEPSALERAQANGWEIIPETEQVSESQSVDAASRICAGRGVGALLRLPIDIPMATAEDIDAILAEIEEAPSAVLVPSRDGTGTNALLRSAPCLFPSHFGPNSFALHLEEARRAGARVKVLHNPRIALDIDEAEDLRALGPDARPGTLLAAWLKTYAN